MSYDKNLMVLCAKGRGGVKGKSEGERFTFEL